MNKAYDLHKADCYLRQDTGHLSFFWKAFSVPCSLFNRYKAAVCDCWVRGTRRPSPRIMNTFTCAARVWHVAALLFTAGDGSILIEVLHCQMSMSGPAGSHCLISRAWSLLRSRNCCLERPSRFSLYTDLSSSIWQSKCKIHFKLWKKGSECSEKRRSTNIPWLLRQTTPSPKRRSGQMFCLSPLKELIFHD